MALLLGLALNPYIISLVFFDLSKLLFTGFLKFKGNFDQNNVSITNELQYNVIQLFIGLQESYQLTHCQFNVKLS